MIERRKIAVIEKMIPNLINFRQCVFILFIRIVNILIRDNFVRRSLFQVSRFLFFFIVFVIV